MALNCIKSSWEWKTSQECSLSGLTNSNRQPETFVRRSRIQLQHGHSTLSRTVLNACSWMAVCQIPEMWRLPDCLHHLLSWKTLRMVPQLCRLNEPGYCQNVYLPRKCRNYKNLNWPKRKKKKKKMKKLAKKSFEMWKIIFSIKICNIIDVSCFYLVFKFECVYVLSV